MDFRISDYSHLLLAFKSGNYDFQNQIDDVISTEKKGVVLRHDVDRSPVNSLIFAAIQHEAGIVGTYYFRVAKESWDERIITQIAELGHEIGYHYEDFDLVVKKHRAQSSGFRTRKTSESELAELAIESFLKNMDRMRKIATVKSICMHGSPLSKWDNRLLWKYYDYKEYGIYLEPYFDVDFTNMLYLTDTGRSWSGSRFSIRDKVPGVGYTQALPSVSSSGKPVPDQVSGEERYEEWVVKPKLGSLMNMTKEGLSFQARYKYRSTGAIINAAEIGSFPESAMITFHPQRWHGKAMPWVKELLFQAIKNRGKYFLIKLRS
jgi:hypothetical protein